MADAKLIEEQSKMTRAEMKRLQENEKNEEAHKARKSSHYQKLGPAYAPQSNPLVASRRSNRLSSAESVGVLSNSRKSIMEPNRINDSEESSPIDIPKPIQVITNQNSGRLSSADGIASRNSPLSPQNSAAYGMELVNQSRKALEESARACMINPTKNNILYALERLEEARENLEDAAIVSYTGRGGDAGLDEMSRIRMIEASQAQVQQLQTQLLLLLQETRD